VLPDSVKIRTADDLGTLSGIGTDYSEALAINDLDEVVGASRDSESVTNAFVHRPSTGFTDLGVINGQSPAHNYSIAYGINNAGQVVGYSKSGTYPSDLAFIWQKGYSITNLNIVIPTGTGWILRSAEWINDKGKIVGWGNIGTQVRGFLLDPTK